jgi:phosphatidylglycerophosphate synthase
MLRAYLLAYQQRIASFSGLGRIACWFCQTFDAVDGKQARRTNSSSPLGELFDHGNSLISSCI